MWKYIHIHKSPYFSLHSNNEWKVPPKYFSHSLLLILKNKKDFLSMKIKRNSWSLEGERNKNQKGSKGSRVASNHYLETNFLHGGVFAPASAQVWPIDESKTMILIVIFYFGWQENFLGLHRRPMLRGFVNAKPSLWRKAAFWFFQDRKSIRVLTFSV